MWVSGPAPDVLLAKLHPPFLLSSPADPLLQYVQMAVHTTQLPLAQAALQMAPTEGGYETHSLPCLCGSDLIAVFLQLYSGAPHHSLHVCK